jgi:hypothetical protein
LFSSEPWKTIINWKAEYTQKFTGYGRTSIDMEYDTIHKLKSLCHLRILVAIHIQILDVLGWGCLNTKRRFIGIEKDNVF